MTRFGRDFRWEMPEYGLKNLLWHDIPGHVFPGRSGILSQIGIDNLISSGENDGQMARILAGDDGVVFSVDARRVTVGGMSLWPCFSGNMRWWTAGHGQNVIIPELP